MMKELYGKISRSKYDTIKSANPGTHHGRGDYEAYEFRKNNKQYFMIKDDHRASLRITKVA